MNVEDILINLKVIEQIDVNQKLNSNGQYLNIEYESIVPEGVRRWIRRDNRQAMLRKIRNVIQCAIDKIDQQQLDSNDEYENSNLDEIQKYLTNSKQGLNKLKQTYSNCSQTCAQLDVMMDTIDNIQ